MEQICLSSSHRQFITYESGSNIIGGAPDLGPGIYHLIKNGIDLDNTMDIPEYDYTNYDDNNMDIFKDDTSPSEDQTSGTIGTMDSSYPQKVEAVVSVVAVVKDKSNINNKNVIGNTSPSEDKGNS